MFYTKALQQLLFMAILITGAGFAPHAAAAQESKAIEAYNEGANLWKAGDYEGAKARFKEALELKPDLVEPMAVLAFIYLREGSWADAAKMAERHLQLKPGVPRMLQIRWEAYRALGDAEKEKMAFKALAASDPERLAVEFYNKGIELYESGNMEEAKSTFERLLEVDPNHAHGYYHLGLCYVSMGESAKAKEHLLKFLELAPDAHEAVTAKEMLGYLN